MWKRLSWALAGCGFITLFAQQPVAVIAVSVGNAIVTNAEHRSQAAHSLDWLSAGMVIETAQGARVVVAFANGRRYELGSGCKVSITADGPANASGPLRELERLPPMPKLPAINVVSRAAAMGGMRVRPLDSVRLLFPHAGLSTLPEHTVLRFRSEDAGSRYQVEVADQGGAVVFRSEAAATDVSVPAHALKAGQSYQWRVCGANSEVLGQATFTTASDETMALRTTFKAAISGSDADSVALLAAMDAQLGLFEEAREELRASILRTAHPETRKLLEIIEEAMR